jgi:hypothetical protein
MTDFPPTFSIILANICHFWYIFMTVFFEDHDIALMNVQIELKWYYLKSWFESCETLQIGNGWKNEWIDRKIHHWKSHFKHWKCWQWLKKMKNIQQQWKFEIESRTWLRTLKKNQRLILITIEGCEKEWNQSVFEDRIQSKMLNEKGIQSH